MDTPPPVGRRIRRRWLTLGAVLAGLFVLWLASVYGQPLLHALAASSATVAGWVEARPVLGALAFLAIAAFGKITPFPGGIALMVAGGYLFGPIPGALLSAAGAALSALLVAVVGRRILFDPIHERWGHHFDKIEHEVAANSFNYLLAVRLLPILPAWLVNLLPIAFPIRLRTVGAATFLGLIPISLIVASLGARLSDLAEAEKVSPMVMFEWPTLAPLLALAALALAPVVWKHVRSGRGR